MTENPYTTPSCSPDRTNIDCLAHRSAVILPAGLVALDVVALGAVTSYWLSFSEEHLEDKQSVIVFFIAAGSIIGVGCGYLTARVLRNAIPVAYASFGIVVIIVALVLIRSPNYMGAAHINSWLTFGGIILLNTIVFVARRMHAPVINLDSQEDAKTD